MSDAFERLKSEYSACFEPFHHAIASKAPILHKDNVLPGNFDGKSIGWNARRTLAASGQELCDALIPCAVDLYARVEDAAKADAALPKNQRSGSRGFEGSVSARLLAASMVLEHMVGLLADASGPGWAFRAAQSLCSKPLPLLPDKLKVDALRLILRRSDPAEAAEDIRLAAPCVFDSDSCPATAEAERWRGDYEADVEFSSRSDLSRFFAWAAADALQLLSKRPELSAPLCSLFASALDRSSWNAFQHEHCGSTAAESVGWAGLKNPKLDKNFLAVLTVPFLVGFSNYYSYQSKSGKIVFDAVLDDLAERQISMAGDPKLPVAERYLAGAAWISLDKKRIQAFDARFPGLSDIHMEAAIAQRARHDYSANLDLERLLEDSKTARWARRHFTKFIDDNGSFKLYGTSVPEAPSEILRAFCSAKAAILQKEIDAEIADEAPKPRKPKARARAL